jgi:Mn2+/Fe2+ NRAMP family transporter
MMVGLSLNFIGLNPVKALIYAAVLNGIVAPVILALIVLISSNKKLMGHWANKRSTTVAGWAVTLIMAVVGVAAIVVLLQGS